MINIITSLYAAQQNYISHGDVKPNNILINENKWLLSDFGTLHKSI